MADYMRCPKCGEQNFSNNKFCQYCYAQFSGNYENKTSIPISPSNKLVLKPVFIGWAVIAGTLPLYIFLTLWGTGFCGGFGSVLFKYLGLPSKYSYGIAFIFFTFILPIIIYNLQKKSYEQMSYSFSNMRLDYYEGFLTVEEKSIDLRNVVEVYLRKGIIQRNHNLGTIVLSVSGVGLGSTGRISLSGFSGNGITISDIQNPDIVYHQVKEWIAKAQGSQAA